jgi:ribosomal protein S27E
MDIREDGFYCEYCDDTFQIRFDNDSDDEINCPCCGNTLN